MDIDNTIFGGAENLNARRDNFRDLIKSSFENEEFLWLTEEEYADIISGICKVPKLQGM